MPRPLLQLVLAALFVALGLGGGQWLLGTAPEPGAAAPRVPQAVPIEVHTVAPRTVAQVVTAQGLVAAARRVTLTHELGGRVVAVHPGWREGARVGAGDLLVAVDPRDAELALAGAEAALALAEVEVGHAAEDVARAAATVVLAAERLAATAREEARWAALEGEGRAEASRLDAAAAARLGAALEHEAARTRSSAALARADAAPHTRDARRAARDLAAVTLERTRASAPFDGVLTGPAPVVGAWLAPGVPLGTLHDDAALRVVVQLPEADAARLTLGMPCEVRLAGEPVARTATVGARGASADPLTRSVPVELELPAAQGRLAPPVGGTAEVALPLAAHADALWVPREAVVQGPDRASVFVVELAPDGPRVRAQAVELGGIADGGHIVVAGLAAGTVVARAPVRLLGDGARVVLPSAEPAAGAQR